MNITVYLGANEGNDPTLKTAVRELGAWIGGSGHALMGELAESVLEAGGEVTGVEPQFFIDEGLSTTPLRGSSSRGICPSAKRR